MIDKININPIHLDPATAAQQGPRPEAAKNRQVDATLQIDYQRLIEQAAKEPPADLDAVQKARELLQSGRPRFRGQYQGCRRKYRRLWRLNIKLTSAS